MHHDNRNTDNQNDCGTDSYHPIHRLPRTTWLYEFAVTTSPTVKIDAVGITAKGLSMLAAPHHGRIIALDTIHTHDAFLCATLAEARHQIICSVLGIGFGAFIEKAREQRKVVAQATQIPPMSRSQITEWPRFQDGQTPPA
jgi:hypothetical protein